jgi:branched-chain amino acid transport system permease protein
MHAVLGHTVLALTAHWKVLPDDTIIGLVLGGTYALAAIGLVLIYRVSGVLNFAHGAVAMFSAFMAFQVSVRHSAPPWIGLIVAVLTGTAIGLFMERFTIRPLAGRPALTKVVVTIGWLLVLQTAAGRIWGNNAYHGPVEVFPTKPFHLVGTNLNVGYDELATLGAALLLSLGVAALLKYTTLGAQLRAVADDPDAAQLWGINVRMVTAASWAVGSAMAAVAGVLITPRIAFTPFSLTVIVIDAFVAALIGRLSSLPLTVVGAMFLGLAQTYPGAFVSNNAAASGLASFLLVIGTLAVLFRPGFARVRLA